MATWTGAIAPMPRRLPRRSDPSKLPPTAPYWVRLKAWREWRELSQTGLFLKGNGSVHFSSIAAYEMEPKPTTTGGRPRWRVPSPEALAALAYALDFPVASFPEFRLAKARELLDERVQGLESALRCLDAFDAAQQALAEQESASEAQRIAATGRPEAATSRESDSPGA